MAKKNELLCSACGAGNGVDKVSYNDSVAVCEKCLDVGKETLLSVRAENQVAKDADEKQAGMSNAQAQIKLLKKPSELVALLDERVEGQEYAKEMLAVAIYQHQKRIILKKNGISDGIKKSNLLLIGQTGCGKTLLAETIAKLTDLPIVIEDATPLTEAGYIGDSVEDLVISLVEKCDGDIERAELQGIVFVDEIDKLCTRGDSASLNRDPSGEGVQAALLKMVEGSIVRIPEGKAKKQKGGKINTIDTSNILFIVSGAFSGIEKIIESSKGKQSIGFLGEINQQGDTIEDSMGKVETTHLVKFGMKSEFIGRFSTIVQLNPLTKDIMKRIVLNDKSSCYASHKLLALADGIELSIDEDAVDLIAEYSLNQKVGARGIDGTMNKILKEFSYTSPESGLEKFTITKELVKDTLQIEG